MVTICVISTCVVRCEAATSTAVSEEKKAPPSEAVDVIGSDPKEETSGPDADEIIAEVVVSGKDAKVMMSNEGESEAGEDQVISLFRRFHCTFKIVTYGLYSHNVLSCV